MKKFIFAVFLLFMFFIAACGTTKIIKETVIKETIDTIYVELPERVDTVYKEDVAIITGEIGEIFTAGILDDEKDTVIVVQFMSGDTTFIVDVYPDTFIVEKLRIDTVQVITNIEELTILEQWWWLFLIVIGAVILIIILIRW